MRTGSWSDLITSRALVPFSVITLGKKEQRAIPISSQRDAPIPLDHPSPSFQSFQEASELPVSGQLDDATSARMR